ncbi:MAG: alpha/beta hydrolase family protein [Promethearchaeota archaeon]
MYEKYKDNIEGNWQGNLNVGKIELPITFIIKKDDIGDFTAKLFSPKQGQTIEANVITYKNKELQIDFNTIGGKFKGTYLPSFQKIGGKWYQRGQKFDVILEQIANVNEIKRSQELHKPYPYVEEQVAYNSTEENITLAGTLTYPRNKSRFPATILISGSGALDRDETIFGHHPFLVLADNLTRRGIAVLRVDDRGVGGSTGNYMKSTSIDIANDVIAGINYLKSRKEIDPRKIGLIGHSEGGVIAPIVANLSPDVAFIVLMAGPGLPLEEILYKQAELIGRGENLSEDLITMERSLQEKLFSIIKKESNNVLAKSKLEKVISKALNKMKDQNLPILSQGSIEAQIEFMLSPWFRDFLKYDPRIALSQVKCPVLALNGEKDLQVPSKENLSAIELILKSNGNTHYEVKELPNLNHLFQTAQTGALSEYVNIEETISPIALKVIGDWILEQSRNLT